MIAELTDDVLVLVAGNNILAPLLAQTKRGAIVVVSMERSYDPLENMRDMERMMREVIHSNPKQDALARTKGDRNWVDKKWHSTSPRKR